MLGLVTVSAGVGAEVGVRLKSKAANPRPIIIDMLLMFIHYLPSKRHAVCALWGQAASSAGTAARVEKALRAAGWQAVELQTPARVYGGLVCCYCAETFGEEGVFQTDRDEWQEAVEAKATAVAGRKLR